MQLPKRLAKQTVVDIADYYAIKLGAIWRGVKQENAAFWWLCIYTFFEYVRPQSIYPVIDIVPWAQILLILTFVTAFSDQTIKWVRNPQNPLLLLLFVIILLSSAFAFQPSIAWGSINVVVNWILVYFLIITIVNSEKRLFVFVLLFLLFSFKMSQHGFRGIVARGFSFSGWGASGAPGWFRNSGEFGIQMTIFVPLSIAFILPLREHWGNYKKLFFYLLPVTGLFSIIATSSRGALLAIVAVGCWFILKSRVGIKGVAGILIVAWVLYALLPQEQMERLREMGEDDTSVQRVEYWIYGLDIIHDNPGLGIGYANWRDYCWFNNPGGIGVKRACEMPHNIFIEAGAELGVPGLLVFVLMCLLIFSQNARTRLNAKKSDNKFILYIAYGLDGGLIGYLVSGFFIAAFYYPFFWFQLAMTVALHEVSKKKL